MTAASSSHPAAELIDLITTKALKRGTFRLASGREASF
jgi:orotate phosphoribosyltransferase